MQNPSADETADEQKLVNSYFDEVASYWGELYEGSGVQEFVHQERLRIVLDLVDRIGLPASTRVLEVGCGAGMATVALGKKGYAVEATDTVQAMVDSTRQRAIKAGLQSRVRSSLEDVHSLSFPDRAFGLVVAMGVLPWLPSIEKPMLEMSRVLQPAGYLIVTVDNRRGLRWFLDPLTNPLLRPAKEMAKRALQRLGLMGPAVRPHLTSARECDAALRAAGLRKVEGVTLGFGPFSLLKHQLLPNSVGLTVHRRLQALADRGFPGLRSAGSQSIVLARKRATT